ncbi:pectinesterase family protein [Paenibacillus sp. y28]|uniref:pectinesterase family protein n=1 Tax=Paenibacillus sp. y28 TaxID=3129110 RepID=UPI003019D717
MQQFTVAQDGSGDFTTIQAAIDTVRVHWQVPSVIHIKNGVYREKITIPDNKTLIHLIGESVDGTILTYHQHANMIGVEGQPLGTFRTAVVSALGDDFRMERLTVHNTAGVGEGIGQAVALYLAGDRAVINNVRLLSYQDTLYTCKGRHYFTNCYIEGHVDYIFGEATAVFRQCELHSLRGGYITAACTAERTPVGYVFIDCRLTAASEDLDVYLGRPWRPHAHTVFIHTWMGAHIHPEGWDNWRDPNNEQTVRYGEFGSTGPGGNTGARVSWSRQLTAEEAGHLTPERILAGVDGWNPIN